MTHRERATRRLDVKPERPVTGDIYMDGGKQFVWDGERWAPCLSSSVSTTYSSSSVISSGGAVGSGGGSGSGGFSSGGYVTTTGKIGAVRLSDITYGGSTSFAAAPHNDPLIEPRDSDYLEQFERELLNEYRAVLALRVEEVWHNRMTLDELLELLEGEETE